MRSYFLFLFSALLSVAACTDKPAESDPQLAAGSGEPLSAGQNTRQSLGVALAAASRPYVAVQVVSRQTFAATVQAPARTEFRTRAQATVGAVISGKLTKIHVQPGATVKAGAPLAELVSREAAQLRADIARTKAELQRAEDRARRQEQMRASGVGLEVERVEAKLLLRQAQADYARAVQAERLLGNGASLENSLLLRAPIDGMVLKVAAAIGSAVEAGSNLFELGEANALRIVADVFESDLPAIAPGAQVQLRFPALPAPVTGHIAEIGALVATDLRRAPVYIDLDQPNARLKPGMFAQAAIQVADPGRLVLPVSAVLIKDGKRTVVYLETGEGQYQSRDIKIGRERDGRVPVLDGLNDGDKVVVSGALLLDSEAQMLL